MKTFLQSLPETITFCLCIGGLVFAGWTGCYEVGIVAAVALVALLAAVIKPVKE